MIKENRNEEKEICKLIMADGIGRNSVTEYVHFITSAVHAAFDYENLYRDLKKTEYVQEIHSVFPNGHDINIATVVIGKNRCIVNLSDDLNRLIEIINNQNGKSNE